MPELPEVETVVRGLEAMLVGVRIARVEARREKLRLPLPAGFAARLAGRRVNGVGRRAKYGLIQLDDGTVLLFHLGMSGSFRRLADDEDAGRHDHLLFEAEGGLRLAFHDPRRFGLVDLIDAAALAQHPLLRDLGPEPLSNGFNGAELATRLAGRRTPIKAALLDQRVVAGVGNIYASESLHEAGLSPRRQASHVGAGRAERLARAIRLVLERAIAAGGSTLRDHLQVDGTLGYFQHQFKVYDRAGAPCPRSGCGGTVKRLVQAGRSSFYCPACQR